MPDAPATSPMMTKAGLALSGLASLVLLGSGGAKLAGVADVQKVIVDTLGYPAGTPMLLGVLEVGSVVLYLVPRTATLGAILLTGYLGGAISAHVRAADGQWPTPLMLGLLVWAGLALRDGRFRELLPLRKG